MYSTLLILDKPRHLRYTFGAIDELEQAIPGGFLQLFTYPATGENGFRILRDLLYAGLKWEDQNLTIQDIGLTLLYFSAHDMNILLGIWKKVFDALSYDQWICSPKPKDNDTTDITIPQLLDHIEKVAYGTMSLLPHELYALTPRELNIMLEKYGELENYRVGLICATIMNSQGGKKGGEPFQVSDFITIKKEPKIMSNDEIKNVLQRAFGGI